MRIFLRIKGLRQRKEYFKRTEWDRAEYYLGNKIIFACFWEKELNEARNAWSWRPYEPDMRCLDKFKYIEQMQSTYKTMYENNKVELNKRQREWKSPMMKVPRRTKSQAWRCRKNLIQKELCIFFFLFFPLFYFPLFFLFLPSSYPPLKLSVSFFLSTTSNIFEGPQMIDFNLILYFLLEISCQ